MTLTVPAPSSLRTVQTVNAAKLSADNIGDRIQFSQDNGWRGGLLTVNGTITGASQYRPMFEMARVEVDGELYAVRYETPVELARGAGRLPMTGADYRAPKKPRPGIKRDPIPVVSQEIPAFQLNPRHTGWALTLPSGETIPGVIEDVRRAADNASTVIVRTSDDEVHLPGYVLVTIARMTGADPEDEL